jgi:hypothetical protein
MAPRIELHAALKAILNSDFVYFQPPANIKMQYPCIVYERSRIQVDFANNSLYKSAIKYTLTLIDRNADSVYLDAISKLPLCAHDRFYIADNLNHDVFTIYF